MMRLIEDSAKTECADDTFDKEYRIIADKIKDLKKLKTKELKERHLAEIYELRLQDIDGYMKKVNYLKREFDDDLVRRLLQSVRVLNGSKIEIQFQSGITIKQEVLCED